jgi:hypothetical protein
MRIEYFDLLKDEGAVIYLTEHKYPNIKKYVIERLKEAGHQNTDLL